MENTLTNISRTIMHTAPLCPVAVGMIGGIILDDSLTIKATTYGILFLATGAVALARSVRVVIGPLLVMILSACLGGMGHLYAIRTIPASSLERFTHETKHIARVRGVVVSPPRLLDSPPNPFARWTYRTERTTFLLQVRSVEGPEGDDLPATGRIRVSVDEAVLDLQENESVEVFGWLYRWRPPRNPGSFDWATYHRRHGIVAGRLAA